MLQVLQLKTFFGVLSKCLFNKYYFFVLCKMVNFTTSR